MGQAIGAIATAVAIWVALRLANKEARHRREEEHAKAKAQAKLVLVNHVGFEPEYNPTIALDWEKHYFTVGVLNISDRPILSVQSEVAIEPRALFALKSHRSDFLDPDRHKLYQSFDISIGKQTEIYMWRVSWEDPDGIWWEVCDQGSGPRLSEINKGGRLSYKEPILKSRPIQPS